MFSSSERGAHRVWGLVVRSGNEAFVGKDMVESETGRKEQNTSKLPNPQTFRVLGDDVLTTIPQRRSAAELMIQNLTDFNGDISQADGQRKGNTPGTVRTTPECPAWRTERHFDRMRTQFGTGNGLRI